MRALKINIYMLIRLNAQERAKSYYFRFILRFNWLMEALRNTLLKEACLSLWAIVELSASKKKIARLVEVQFSSTSCWSRLKLSEVNKIGINIKFIFNRSLMKLWETERLLRLMKLNHSLIFQKLIVLLKYLKIINNLLS